MQIDCPQCNKRGHVTRKSVVECYTLEFSCGCGYFLSITDYHEKDCFKNFTDQIIEDRREVFGERREVETSSF